MEKFEFNIEEISEKLGAILKPQYEKELEEIINKILSKMNYCLH